MREWIRSHLRFANVVSLAALFVALGGTATAVTYVVSSNSQIGPGTVSGHKPPTGDHANVIEQSLNSSDLAPGAVTAGKIANGAVGTSKLGTIPAARVTDPHTSSCTDNSTISGEAYPITFKSVAFETQNGMASSCATAIRAPVAGTYAVSAELGWAASPDNDRKIWLQVYTPSNAYSYTVGIDEVPPVGEAGKWTQQTTSAIIQLKAGEKVELWGLQDSGGNLSLPTGELAVAWLGP